MVFVTSEGIGLQALQKSASALSRAECFEIGDLSTEQAFDYIKMVCKDKVSETNSEEIRCFINEVTGGRFTLLEILNKAIKKGTLLSDLRASMLQKARLELVKFGMLDVNNNSEYKRLWLVAKEILASEGAMKQISSTKVIRILGSGELYNKLRWSNFFAYHKSTGTISFQSKPIQILIENYPSMMK